MYTREEFKRIVAEFVQPLYRGSVEYTSKIKSRLYGVIPFGNFPDAQNASPYGISSWPVKGIFGFFQNLGGDTGAPIIMNHLDQKRPDPSSEGEVIFYCRKPDGTFPIQIFLQPTGLLKLVVSSKVQVVCDNIELGDGTLEKVLNGETFQAWFNQHKHLGNMGVPTGVPMDISPPEHLSTVVKVKI